MLIGLIPAAAAVYALAIWPAHRFPLLRWDLSFGIGMSLCVVGVWAAGWLTVARHELLPARGLLRSLTDPLIVGILATLFIGSAVYLAGEELILDVKPGFFGSEWVTGHTFVMRR